MLRLDEEHKTIFRLIHFGAVRLVEQYRFA
jgi:hypothetical protein